jgi:hypothetical protein
MDKMVQANPASEHRLGRSFTKERMVGCGSRNSVLPVVIVIQKVMLDNLERYQVNRELCQHSNRIGRQQRLRSQDLGGDDKDDVIDATTSRKRRKKDNIEHDTTYTIINRVV